VLFGNQNAEPRLIRNLAPQWIAQAFCAVGHGSYRFDGNFGSAKSGDAFPQDLLFLRPLQIHRFRPSLV